jgi:serine/threonine protein kinase
MSSLWKRGQTPWTETSHEPCCIEDALGEGGQGVVYRVNVGGRLAAVKWYYPEFATPGQRVALETLVKRGTPTGKFLWPLELVSAPSHPGFGYLMPLREERYKGMADLMKRRLEPTFRALATLGFELAHSFLQLHSKGLCYRDISFGNVFFDPGTGEVLICDNDNVSIDGVGEGGVLGTPRFMAPEVVRGDSPPSIQTDLYSLAVLLFYIFIMHHPLEGKKELAIHSFDLPAMNRLYGTEPAFIYDPDNASNRPVQGVHDNAFYFWPIYPQFLRDLFTRAFTDGIRDPLHGRVREGEWRAAMINLRDAIHYCQHCGTENFADSSSQTAGICWHCNRRLRLPIRLRINRQIVMLNHDTQLFPHHLASDRPYDFSRPLAAVARHPDHTKVWGLKNLSDAPWFITTPRDPQPKAVPPGLSLTLLPGAEINFGKVLGQIL